MIDLTAIGIGVSTDKLRQGSKDLDAFGRSANTAAGKADQSTQSMGAMAGMAGRLTAILGTAGLGATLIRTIDSYTKYTAQLKLATRSQEEYNQALADVQVIAVRAQASLSSVGVLYARINNSLREVGASQAEVNRITENVALALKVSGATAQESSSAILQLSQAFGSGVLRGEEFNAVNEAAPALIRALAESIGQPVGAMRELAANGKLTLDVLRNLGDDKLLDKFRQQAVEVRTIAGAWQVLKNNLFLTVGQINEATGASNGLSTALLKLGESKAIRIPFEAMAVLAVNVVYVFKQIGNEIGGIAAQLAALGRLDFAAFANIREMMIADAKAARIEVDKLSEAILNPKVPETEKSIANEVARINSGLTTSNKEADKLADKLAREKEQRLNAYVQTQNEMLALTKKYQDISTDIENKIIKESREARIESEKRFLDIKQDLANQNFKLAQEAFKKEADAYNRIFERANDNLSRSLTDSIVRGFERGENFIDNFKNAITNAFRGYFVNIGVNFAQESLSGTISKIGKSVLGAIGLGGSSLAAASDGVATAGLLDSAKGVFDVITKGFDGANAALQGSIESFGAFLSNGQGGIFDAIGGAIGQYSSVISGALPYAGAVLKLLQGDVKGAAFTGGGAAIGSLVGGPVGGAIGAALGGALGGMFGGKKQPPRTVTQLPQVSEQFNAQLSTLLGGFGLANNVSSSAEYRGRGGGSGYGTLISNVNGEAQHRAIQYKDAYGEATMQQFIQTALTTYLVQSIQQTDLSQAIKNLFSGLTDNAQIQSMIQATIMLKDANTALSERFGLTTDTAAELAKQSGLANEELVNLVTTLAQAAGAFTTPAQQLIKFRDTLTTNLGRSLPATLDAFDAILKSFDTTTTAGRGLFLTMFNLRDEFAQFTASLDAIKKGVGDSIFGLLSPAQQQAMNQARLSEEFAKFNLAVPNSVQQLIAIGQGIDYTTEAGLNLALAFPTLVQAFQATQGAVDALANSLNPDRFRTFFDFAVASSYSRQGLSIPAANMPSYAVGTSYVPNDGVAMLHQGEAVLTKSQNTDMTMNSGKVVSLLEALVSRVGALEYDMGRAADGTQRTARELEDLTSGDSTITTQAA